MNENKAWTDEARILSINSMRFKLSDNFEGTVAEALRELADYLEKPTPDLPPADWEKVKADGWPEFVDTVNRGGRVLAMGVNCHRLNTGKNLWEKMPRGVM
ncbi:MAG: hypothetical protein V3T43_02845 [Nitrosomonadaceae bacterium]